ncbi:MAG: TIGR01777 family protein [Mucilaginibacter polytrichastri]|nr:TIGR01777 family protein [Mucilaginibacter polytrichastri]
MKCGKIILAGGNGYLGRVFAKYYQPLATEVVILSRKAHPHTGNVRTVVWDGRTESGWISELEGADLVINLCGKNVNCRYTPENREAIRTSRKWPTEALGSAIAKCSAPPKCWINIVSATIYRHAEDRPQDEENGEYGSGFSVDVCRMWEDTFFGCDTPGTRKVALRMSIVIGRSDGAFPRLMNLVRAGLGGMQGNGRQYMSWVHEHDAARCTEFILENSSISGVLNCTAPSPVSNSEFMRTIRETYGFPFGLPSPAWLLDLGAKLIGTETELILKSRWVLPKRLLNAGFVFQFPEAGHAIRDIVSTRA